MHLQLPGEQENTDSEMKERDMEIKTLMISTSWSTPLSPGNKG